MYEDFSPTDIALDRLNPRLELPATDDRDAIRELIEANESHLFALMEDISRTGRLDPSNPPIVVREEGRIVVLEGNRRIASLKLLNDPALAPSDELAQKVQGVLARNATAPASGKGPDIVTCAVEVSRESARPWVELKHTGVNAGVGTSRWGGYQRNTWRRDNGNQTDRAWVLIRYVVRQFADDAVLLADVRWVKEKAITTLGRLFADPEVRGRLGVDYLDDDLAWKHDLKAVQVLLKQIFNEFHHVVKVDKIKNPKLRQQYLDSIASLIPGEETSLPVAESDDLSRRSAPSQPSQPLKSPATPAHEPATNNGVPTQESLVPTGGSAGANEPTPETQPTSPEPTPVPATTPAAAGTGTSDPASTSAPASIGRVNSPPAERAVFQSLRVPAMSSAIRTLLREAQELPINDFPKTTAILLRVLVELTVAEFLESVGVESQNNLGKDIKSALRRLDPNIADEKSRKQEFHWAWVRSDGSVGLGVRTMQNYVHDRNSDALASEVRTFSKDFRPLITAIDLQLQSAGRR